MEERKDNLTIEEGKNNFPILKILYRNWILILSIVIICTVVGTLFGALTAKPVYTAKSNVMLKVYLETNGTESIYEMFQNIYLNFNPGKQAVENSSLCLRNTTVIKFGQMLYICSVLKAPKF